MATNASPLPTESLNLDEREATSAQTQPRVAWIESTRDLTASIRERLRCNRLLLGIVVAQHPRCDELLVCDRFGREVVKSWLESGFRHDSVYRHALRLGAATGTAGETGWACDEIAGTTPVACITLPEGYPDRRHWVTIVTRPRGAFTDAELRAIGLHTRQWIAQFNRPSEAKMCRMLVGVNDRVIHADPKGEAWLDAAQIDMKRVMLQLREVVSQRWPDLADRNVHDLVFSLSGQPVWIRFERRRALLINEAEHWYIEMRPIDRDDLPCLAVLEDDRVARAVGYIHDQFAQSPSLADIASVVDVSAFHFHRRFAKLVGTTPKQYVLQKQVQVAKWLLAANRSPIRAIADASGFASHGHFTSTFRRMQKLSPTEYREQIDRSFGEVDSVDTHRGR